MSTYDMYTSPVATETWDVPAAGAARFSWEYDSGRQQLLDLYQRGKDKQWDATKRIDWEQPVNPLRVMETGEEIVPIYGSRQWEKLNQAERDELSRHLSSWLFSQFLHGEQGALTVAARIVESVPDVDSKFYAATQVMDEARHVELFNRFIKEKIGLFYPVNDHLAKLLADALSDSRWDLPYLGMQVLIEGLALAAFGVHRDITGNPLVKQLLAYVMQDEARHVAFGRLALRDYYAELTVGGARRAGGVRGRGLLPDARPVRRARRCTSASTSTWRSAWSSPTAPPRSWRSASSCSAASCPACGTSACGGRRFSGPTSTSA